MKTILTLLLSCVLWCGLAKGAANDDQARSFLLNVVLNGADATLTNGIPGTNTLLLNFLKMGISNIVATAGPVAGIGTNNGVLFVTNNTYSGGWGMTLVTNASTIAIVPTNNVQVIATNATSVTADFSDAANVQMMNTWFHLTTNLVVSPTNLVVGRTFTLRFPTNSLTYDVMITNTAANDLRWPLNFPTNGSTSFTKTNNVVCEVYLTVRSNLTIVVNAAYYK